MIISEVPCAHWSCGAPHALEVAIAGEVAVEVQVLRPEEAQMVHVARGQRCVAPLEGRLRDVHLYVTIIGDALWYSPGWCSDLKTGPLRCLWNERFGEEGARRARRPICAVSHTLLVVGTVGRDELVLQISK